MPECRLGELDVIHHVALSDKKIKPAVVVIVNPFRSPTGMGHSRSTQTDCISDVVEGSLVIAEKPVFLIGESVHEHRRPATIFVIAEISTHPATRVAFLVVG